MLECCESQCAQQPACAALGLIGLCCPTLEGVLLGCCSSDDYTQAAPAAPAEMVPPAEDQADQSGGTSSPRVGPAAAIAAPPAAKAEGPAAEPAAAQEVVAKRATAWP